VAEFKPYTALGVSVQFSCAGSSIVNCSPGLLFYIQYVDNTGEKQSKGDHDTSVSGTLVC